MTTRILLADDHVLFRSGVNTALSAHPDFQVVGEARDGLEAIELARELQPDLILMDVGMPNCNGLQATQQIKQEMPHIIVAILTVSDDDEDLYQAVRAGAAGFLEKGISASALRDKVERIIRGEAALSGQLAARIPQEFVWPGSRPDTRAPRAGALSDRELQVLELVAAGKSNSDIAEALVLTENTVKRHLRHILEKLHLENRVQAAVYAVSEGLVSRPRFHR